ncbi:hypothetical protein L3049_06190 [Labilibaculum sp. DW002]|uniref:Uncharacterized protein n=1 Tax=Paralabilibaculum antarcticum TaxID=2912572 RepID=A0ABT5VQ90_9BACT|nr:hypothetical protein [Labilibaculum sp. DW002]MDE5417593.1 hypothetical protein [Labilibaculum sp. DW002]
MEKKRSPQQSKSLPMLFDAWLSRADEKDKALAPNVRKGKWALIVIAFLLLFGSSFIWLPVAKFVGHQLESPTGNVSETNKIQTGTSTFAMPVDTFENQLKRNLHENLSTKK